MLSHEAYIFYLFLIVAAVSYGRPKDHSWKESERQSHVSKLGEFVAANKLTCFRNPKTLASWQNSFV